MANEISFTASLSATLSGQTVTGSASKVVSITGAQIYANVQTLSTSTENLTLGDIATPGYLYLKNLSSTSGEDIIISQEADVTEAGAFIKLQPGEFCLWPTRRGASGDEIKVEAASGTPDLQVIATEL